MIGKALSSDFLKIRRKGIWLLVFLGSVGLLAMQALNFGLRYDYLIDRYKADLWKGLIGEIFSFVPIALYLGATLISSQIANVEHQNNSWKQLLALPISRASVFTAKVLLGLIAMGVACLILSMRHRRVRHSAEIRDRRYPVFDDPEAQLPALPGGAADAGAAAVVILNAQKPGLAHHARHHGGHRFDVCRKLSGIPTAFLAVPVLYQRS